MSASDGGKGSARRPGEGYSEAWERIFGRKTLEEQVAEDIVRGASEDMHRAVMEGALGRKTHFFVHDGWGKYYCKACGKKEDYSNHGETCPGAKNDNTSI